MMPANRVDAAPSTISIHLGRVAGNLEFVPRRGQDGPVCLPRAGFVVFRIKDHYEGG